MTLLLDPQHFMEKWRMTIEQNKKKIVPLTKRVEVLKNKIARIDNREKELFASFANLNISLRELQVARDGFIHARKNLPGQLEAAEDELVSYTGRIQTIPDIPHTPEDKELIRTFPFHLKRKNVIRYIRRIDVLSERGHFRISFTVPMKSKEVYSEHEHRSRSSNGFLCKETEPSS